MLFPSLPHILIRIFLPLFAITLAQAQAIPADRITDWGAAGLRTQPPAPQLYIDMTDHGAVGDGATPTGPAMAAALAAAAGQMTVIEFPAGDFLFTSGILLPDSVIIRGAGAGSTTLIFSLGGAGHCVRTTGGQDQQPFPLLSPAGRGDSIIHITAGAPVEPGDLIRLYRPDEDLVVSPWAVGMTGQIAEVTSVDGGQLELASPLRAGYPVEGSHIRIMHPTRYVGIECLKILRTDVTEEQWSNIMFDKASHCWVRGVESENCNFAHIDLYESTNCEISGNHLHHGFSYGSGGKAYGVNAYHTTGEVLVQDNIFEHLRHSMLVQVGANGNVFGHNYSTDPYWTGTIYPANAAGEIVVHGDHPYMNLFEGNIVSNMVIDDSHGSNGPFNTLFRNRAELWGLLMANSPPTDSTNIVGNEITDPSGLFLINGSGHFLHGNIVQGTVTPEGTGELAEPSYYLQEMPAFFDPVGSWPQVGPGAQAPGTIPAEMRFLAGEQLTVCPLDIGTATDLPGAAKPAVYPNPFFDRITIEVIDSNSDPVEVSFFDPLGKLVQRRVERSGEKIEISDLRDLRPGLYLIELKSANGTIFRSVVVKE